MTYDDLYKCLLIIAEEEGRTPRDREVRKKKFTKAYKKGQLRFDWTGDNILWAYKLCVASLIRGHYHWKGWEGRDNANWALANLKFPYPRWDGSDCRLLVLAEQGLGDEIIFASCFNDLLKQCPRATIECDPRLLPVFERSFDAKFITRWDEEGKPRTGQWYKDNKGPYDMFVPAGELPKIYRRKRGDFPGTPYLKAEGKDWGIGQTATYGISWIGRQGTLNPHDLYRGYGVHYDLQYGDHERPPFSFSPGFDQKDDIDDLFSFVSSLDAVICVPNTLAHIGGSLGITTHVVRPEAVYVGDRESDPEFHNRLRWEFGQFTGRIPWYNSVRTYRSIRDFQHKVR